MTSQPDRVMVWLYTSQFSTPQSQVEIDQLVAGFAAENKRRNISGFLISDGRSVMQLLEGPEGDTEVLKGKIQADERHLNVTTQLWSNETIRAYPHWSLRAIASSEYEALFSEIESANFVTLATRIAQMLFDATFDP